MGWLSARDEILRDKIPMDEIFQIVREGAVFQRSCLSGHGFDAWVNAETSQDFDLGLSFNDCFFHPR